MPSRRAKGFISLFINFIQWNRIPEDPAACGDPVWPRYGLYPEPTGIRRNPGQRWCQAALTPLHVLCFSLFLPCFYHLHFFSPYFSNAVFHQQTPREFWLWHGSFCSHRVLFFSGLKQKALSQFLWARNPGTARWSFLLWGLSQAAAETPPRPRVASQHNSWVTTFTLTQVMVHSIQDLMD